MALAEIEQQLVGKWILLRNENMDTYLKLIGVNFVLRKIAQAANETNIISIEEGDNIRILKKGPKDGDGIFKLGEPFDDKDIQDNPMRVTITWEDGAMVTRAVPKGDKGKPQTVERRIVNEELVMTVTIGETTMKRYYKKDT